jgi:Sec-independent protein translocase protein TatA
MAYRPQIRANKEYGGRHEKAKAKAKKKKSRSNVSHIAEEKHVPTSEEVVNKTLNMLRNLGDQRFILPPFSMHFGRWLSNLRDTLSEFESSLPLSLDDQFVEERSQILSNVAINLDEKQRLEASCEDVAKSSSDTKSLLEGIEKEYAAGTKEIERRQNIEISRLSGNIDVLREELDRTALIKAGIFRAISKKTKQQKEMELTQRLNSAKQELTSAEQNFNAERERLQYEYNRKKEPVVEQIREIQSEIEKQDIDSSLETRRAACEALTNTINKFIQRRVAIT